VTFTQYKLPGNSGRKLESGILHVTKIPDSNFLPQCIANAGILGEKINFPLAVRCSDGDALPHLAFLLPHGLESKEFRFGVQSAFAC